jgi:pimeloyl-ACP methyl ester carboxylesterase
VNPLFIGTAERRIFAIYTPAAATSGKPRAAVLCYPWGIEYIYAHRSMRQLAARLSLSGCHTLRFDYFGTGDSAGEAPETDLAGLESDVESAIEGLKDIADTRKVALIGLRVGANVASRVAIRLANEVEALVLWDPIMSGEQYVRSLQESPQANSDDAGTSAMLQDLRAIDLRSSLEALPERSLIIMTERPEAHAELAPLLAASAKPVSSEFVAAPCPWVEAITTTGALPVRVIQRIEEWLR